MRTDSDDSSTETGKGSQGPAGQCGAVCHPGGEKAVREDRAEEWWLVVSHRRRDPTLQTPYAKN